MSASDTGFRAEEDLVEDHDDEIYLSVDFPSSLGPDVILPAVGDWIIALGGSCDLLIGNWYFRVMRLDHEILWEGGAPICTELEDSFLWGPHLGQRFIEPPPPLCAEPYRNIDCCCVTREDMEIVIRPDGDSVLVPGEDREVVIDGVRFLASSQGAFFTQDAPCTFDLIGPRGSAFLARLAD